MNNINEVIVAGYIISEPKKIKTPVGKTLAVSLELGIERERSTKNHKLTVEAYDTNAAEILEKGRIGNYMIVPKGTLMTHNHVREIPVICSGCSQSNILEIASEKTTVAAISQIIMVDKPKTKSMLGMNEIYIFGNICSNPNKSYYEGQGDYKTIQIKVATDRDKYHMDVSKQRADYIFCNGFGNLASFIKDSFEKGDLIMVRGFVSERDFEQEVVYTCDKPSCHAKTPLKIKNTAREVIINRATPFPEKYDTKDPAILDIEHKAYKDELIVEEVLSEVPTAGYFASDEDESYDV